MMFEMMPARESSEKPISISSDSCFLSTTFAVEAEPMLLSVRAANCTNFYWFFICCSTPIIMLTRQSFFRSSSRD